MNPHDPEADDPGLDALSRLPRTMTPSEGYADRVLGELRARDLVRQAPRRTPRMLIAAAWFLAGVGTGAAVLSLVRSHPAQPAPVLTASRGSSTYIPAEPVEWY